MEPTYFVKCLDTRDPTRKRTYFVETPDGYDFQSCVDDIADGQFSDIRGVYATILERGEGMFLNVFLDVSDHVCRALASTHRKRNSKDAREFLDYCGFDIPEDVR